MRQQTVWMVQATTADEEARTLATLAYAPSGPLIRATLDFAVSSHVRAQDAPGLLARVAARGGASLAATWQFLQT